MIRQFVSDYTHKGWFGICPIYLAGLDTHTPSVAPRGEWAVPLFVISEWWQGACIYVCSLLDPEYVPCFKFKITGELE